MDANQNHIDRFIGNKIRERRKTLGLSQTDLADKLGISYQQVQRYEIGENTVAVNRLLQIARALGAPPVFFYGDAPMSGPGRCGGEETVISRDPARSLRVLFVDDNKGDEVLFRSAVQRWGGRADIHCVHESDKVMDYLQNHEKKYGHPRPDLIILDINMPKINGLALLKSIKGDAPVKDIPVVILTNSIHVREMREAYQSQAGGFIQKTADFDAYCADVRRTLDYWSQTVVLPFPAAG
jgi:CheY-like chemotaxis protein/DNA-binding XRE family transcriptional regulator